MQQLRIIATLIALITFITTAQNIPIHKWHKVDDFPKFYIETDLKFNWYEAWDECSIKNMSLVAITTPEKQAALEKILKPKLSKLSNIWIGATDLAENDTFIWHSTGKRFEYTNWSKGNPDHVANLEHCVHLFELTNYEWNDAKCEQKMGFICEENLFIHEMQKSLEIKKSFIYQLFSM